MKVENGSVVFDRANEERQTRAFHGLMRALVANNVAGVSEGFRRDLEIIGVGYRARGEGSRGRLPARLLAPDPLQDPRGDRHRGRAKAGRGDHHRHRPAKVGQTAAEIRSLRLPDPYKGKGIKYTDEVIRRKAGKAAGK